LFLRAFSVAHWEIYSAMDHDNPLIFELLRRLISQPPD
jgi:hypothetical protein